MHFVNYTLTTEKQNYIVYLKSLDKSFNLTELNTDKHLTKLPLS